MRRRRLLERSQRARETRDGMGGGSFNPAGMIRLAGFGAAIVVAVAVYVGFHRGGETIYDGHWGALERLIRPIIFGANALELLALVFAGLIALRIWNKMKR